MTTKGKPVKRLIILGALAPLLALSCAGSAQAAYPFQASTPAAPPAVTCTTTTSVLATWQTNVNTATAGTTQCLSNGSYTGPVTINRTATGTVTAASVSGYGAVIDAGMIHNGGSVTYQGLDIKNTTSGAGTNGDCFTEAYGVTAAVTVQYSKIHACNRMGVQMKNCASPPCTTGFANNFWLRQSFVYDVGNTDATNGIGVTLRTSSTGGSAAVSDSDITDGPNDAIDVCGSGISVLRMEIHDMTAGTGIHNDVVQNTTTCPPVTTLTVMGVWTRAIAGSDAHFMLVTGAGNGTIYALSNEIVNVGSGSHAITIGDGTNSVTNAFVNGNTIYGSGSVELKTATGTIKSNVFRNCQDATDAAPWVITGMSTVTVDSNTGSGSGANCTATGTNAANRDPKFVSEPGLDFHLQGTSPEIGTGLAVGGEDIDDQSRPVSGTDDRGSDKH